MTETTNGQPLVVGIGGTIGSVSSTERALRIALEKKGTAVDGTGLKLDMKTMCVHGDATNAVEVATLVRQRLADAGVEVVPLRAVA